MSYITNNLMSGETVAMETRLSGIVYMPALVVGLLAAVLYGAIYNSSRQAANSLPVPAVLLAAALILLIWGFYRRSYAEYAVTNTRVVVKTGLMRRRTTETMLRQVEGITVDQGLLGRVFRYGTLVVEGSGGDRVPYAGIADPMRFRIAVLEQIEANAAPVQPSPAPSTDGVNRNPYDLLEKLSVLKERGIVTDEEFQREKRRILGS